MILPGHYWPIIMWVGGRDIKMGENYIAFSKLVVIKHLSIRQFKVLIKYKVLTKKVKMFNFTRNQRNAN